MDTGELVTVTALLVGVVAILVGIFALMWQMHSQGNRLDTKIDAYADRLSAEIRAQGAKLSDVEREQARLEGVNSVSRIHSHTHEADD